MTKLTEAGILEDSITMPLCNGGRCSFDRFRFGGLPSGVALVCVWFGA